MTAASPRTGIGRIALGLACLMLVLSSTAPRANDSSAAMAVGGLELVNNGQVRMVSEVLRIAPRLVEVDYVFENTGRTDVTTVVAFPLPDLNQRETWSRPFNIPFPQDKNFVGFRVWIDGAEIKPDVEVRAFAAGGEVTAEIKKLGVDLLNPNVDSPAAEPLRRHGLVDGDQYNTWADWTTKISFHWSQTFPAGKRVTVRHIFRPIYGSSYVVLQPSFPSMRIRKDDQRLGGQWCFDQSFNDAELRLFDRQYEVAIKDKQDRQVRNENVQYVLKTGANWAGPIGHFELQIDKGGSELVSTCPIPGLRLQRAPYGFNAVADKLYAGQRSRYSVCLVRLVGSPRRLKVTRETIERDHHERQAGLCGNPCAHGQTSDA
jgi:hypothetical protein